MATVIKKKKIAAADFNPKSLLGLEKDVQRKVLGIVGGIANGLAESLGPTGEVFIGLRGAFRFEAADGSEVLTAPVLWLPTGFDDDIKALLTPDSETGEVKDAAVQFVYEIAVRRAGNPQGYTWEAAPMLNLAEAEKADPVAALFGEAKGQPALPAPEKEVDEKPAKK